MMEKKKNAIIIDEEGIRVRGFEEDEILAYLVHSLCVTWNKAMGNIDVNRAGVKVLDALNSAEAEFKISVLWDAVMDDEESEDDEEDDE